jgi:hypothetical protein
MKPGVDKLIELRIEEEKEGRKKKKKKKTRKN